MGKHPKFDYDSFTQLMKDIEEKYNEDFCYCMPEYLTFNKHLRKIENKETRDFIKKQIRDNKIILTGNGKEDDDKTLVSIAMSLDRSIMSKDKKMEKHVSDLSEEMTSIAKKFIRENRTDFYCIGGDIAIEGLIPKKFKVDN